MRSPINKAANNDAMRDRHASNIAFLRLLYTRITSFNHEIVKCDINNSVKIGRNAQRVSFSNKTIQMQLWILL